MKSKVIPTVRQSKYCCLFAFWGGVALQVEEHRPQPHTLGGVEAMVGCQRYRAQATDLPTGAKGAQRIIPPSLPTATSLLPFFSSREGRVIVTFHFSPKTAGTTQAFQFSSRQQGCSRGLRVMQQFHFSPKQQGLPSHFISGVTHPRSSAKWGRGRCSKVYCGPRPPLIAAHTFPPLFSVQSQGSVSRSHSWF